MLELLLAGSTLAEGPDIDPLDGQGQEYVIYAVPRAGTGIDYLRLDNVGVGTLAVSNVTSSMGGSPSYSINGGIDYDRHTRRLFVYRNDVSLDNTGEVYQYNATITSATRVLTGYPSYRVVRGFAISKDGKFAVTQSRADAGLRRIAYILSIPATNTGPSTPYASTATGQAAGPAAVNSDGSLFFTAGTTGAYIISRQNTLYNTTKISTVTGFISSAFSPRPASGYQSYLALTNGTFSLYGVNANGSVQTLTPFDQASCNSVAWSNLQPDGSAYLLLGLTVAPYLLIYRFDLLTQTLTPVTVPTVPAALVNKGIKALNGKYPNAVLLQHATSLSIIRDAYSGAGTIQTVSTGLSITTGGLIIE